MRRRKAGKPGEWYYCLSHHTVEEGPACRAADRMGPYGSAAEAERALQTAADRTTEWETDPRWRDTEREQGRGGD